MTDRTGYIVAGAVLVAGLGIIVAIAVGQQTRSPRTLEDVADEARARVEAEQRALDAEAAATKAEKKRLIEALTKQQAAIDALLQRLAVAKDDVERAELQKQLEAERVKQKALVGKP